MRKDANQIEIEQIDSVDRLKQCAEIMIEAYNSDPWYDDWTQDSARSILACYYNTPDFRAWIATSQNDIVACCIGNIEPYYTGRNFILKDKIGRAHV